MGAVLLQVTTGESRARMGEVAHQRSDFVILTDTDPGLEDPKAILQVRRCSVRCQGAPPSFRSCPATLLCWDCPCWDCPLTSSGVSTLTLAATDAALFSVRVLTVGCVCRTLCLGGPTSCLSRMLPMCTTCSKARTRCRSGLNPSCTAHSGAGRGALANPWMVEGVAACGTRWRQGLQADGCCFQVPGCWLVCCCHCCFAVQSRQTWQLGGDAVKCAVMK